MKTLIAGRDVPLDEQFLFEPLPHREGPKSQHEMRTGSQQFAESRRFAEDHSGVLVALWLDPATAEELAYTEDPEELHITLWYDPAAGPEDLDRIAAAVREVAGAQDPFAGPTGGMGRFYGADRDVIWVKPDLKGIGLFREELVELLGDPSEYEFSPHITIGYIAKDDPTPFSEDPQQFMAAGQPRDADGKWTLAGSGLAAGASLDGRFTGKWSGTLFHGTTAEGADGILSGDFKPSLKYGTGPLEVFTGTNMERVGHYSKEAVVEIPVKDLRIGTLNKVREVTAEVDGEWSAGVKRLRAEGKKLDSPEMEDHWNKKDDGRLHREISQRLAKEGVDAYMQGDDTVVITNPDVVRGRIRKFSELQQFFDAAQLRVPAGNPQGGRWTKSAYTGRADLRPDRGVRQGAAVGYQGGVPDIDVSRLSNSYLSHDMMGRAETPYDTDRIIVLREYNRGLPATISIQDDAEVVYGNRVMTRGEMRRQIAEEMISGKHDKNFEGYEANRVMDIYMGPPAAGKSGAVAKMSGKRYLEVDSDRIKELIPEFNRGKNANGVHEESSSINDAVLHEALRRGYKIALPIVGKSEASVNQMIRVAKESGYTVNLHLITAPPAAIGKRMVERISSTGRFVDPLYYHTAVKDKPTEVFRKLRNDPRINKTTAWDTTTFPAQKKNARKFADVGQGGRPSRLGRGTPGVGVRVDGEESDGSGLAELDAQPLAYVEDGPVYIYRPAQLYFAAVTIKCGGETISVPLGLAPDDAYDMSETADVPVAAMEEWTAERLQRFAEWLGYSIEPNPESSLGFRVTSPGGKVLGGSVAAQIIAGWQKNPNIEIGDGPGGKKKGKGGKGAAKSPEQKAAEKAQKQAEQLAGAQQRAAESIAALDPETMEIKSKGKLDAADLKDFISAAESKIANATDPKAVREALREMKLNIARYKRELLKPPGLDQQLADTKAKLREALPSAARLAGTTYDENEIQLIIDKHVKQLEGAKSPEEAKKAIKEIRVAVADYKLAEAKARKDAKTAKVKAAKQPRTASEWAEYYAGQFAEWEEPQDSRK